ncbi:hypothetical protein F5Y00DRAFT_134508 [Daldinia vernicosa]|uniref:uncharacterized protein n=1 Tax=Daldinia vernicosa TaxID=114800 RepID=UPI002007945C|nr:uncharacterized protein F5Y00DRAFT_134508 [Daldinia vernicosa]KAI0853193.1 hypothetical protein F5Y00DRAFT_134508 [Daldinia vernicosa]
MSANYYVLLLLIVFIGGSCGYPDRKIWYYCLLDLLFLHSTSRCEPPCRQGLALISDASFSHVVHRIGEAPSKKISCAVSGELSLLMVQWPFNCPNYSVIPIDYADSHHITCHHTDDLGPYQNSHPFPFRFLTSCLICLVNTLDS